MAVIITRNSQQRCTNPRCPVAQVSNSRMVAPNIYNILTAVPDSPYIKMCISSHASSTKHQITMWFNMSLQKSGSSVWNLFYVTLLVPRVGRGLLYMCKICGPVIKQLFNQQLIQFLSWKQSEIPKINCVYTFLHATSKTKLLLF